MFGHIPQSKHKYIYCRAVANLHQDDDAAASVCFPVSAIRGMAFVTNVWVIIRYESPYQYAMGDNDDNDGILFTIPSNTHRTFIDEFTSEVAFGENGLITPVSYTHLTLPTKA